MSTTPPLGYGPNKDVTEMLAVPGLYAVSILGSDSYCKVEVTPNGECHQLNQKGQRDGVLSKRWWHPDSVVEKIS